MSENKAGDSSPRGKRLLVLGLTAIGVVYDKIGTSPIYAIRESFHASYGLASIPQNVLGVLSLIFWSLILVISIKYLVLVLLADNDGEGFELEETTLFPGRETILAMQKTDMAIWREKLFAWMTYNAQRAASYFRIPSDRVVEIGTQIDL